MPVKAIAPWYGGKRTLAPEIIAELGPHRAYWEIFCGSMAVLLAKPPSSFETVNDLHSDLVNLATVIQSPVLGPKLYRRARRAPFSKALFIESRAVCNGPVDFSGPDIDRAFAYLLTSFQGMNGVAGTTRYNLNFATRYTKNGGAPAKRWASVGQSIPFWRRRLRNVQILGADAIALCEKIEDAEGVVIYADPPYLTKGASYLHDFAAADHLRLATALRRFKKTRVVVSYYDAPVLAELYPGWTKRCVYQTKSMVSQDRRGQSNDTIAPEVLLINGKSFVEGIEHGNLIGLN